MKGPAPKTIEERFWPKVKKTGECWLWIGYVAKQTGYGMFYFYNNPSRPTVAHRASWEIHKGRIPPGLYVCHTCDNRLCVNPRHLFIGSAKENMQDCAKKGRIGHGKNHYLSKLAEKDIPAIFDLKKNNISAGEIAKRYGVTHGTIGSILKRQTWKHVIV